MNTTIKFELAKLLKEKGFEGKKSHLWYYKDGTLHETPTNGYIGLKCWNTWTHTQGIRWDAPTISEVVMWLYDKHGIWISVYEYKDWAADVNDNSVFKSNYTGMVEFKTPTEAYEAAIEHILNNLIK